jgi:hypothetical protein
MIRKFKLKHGISIIIKDNKVYITDEAIPLPYIEEFEKYLKLIGEIEREQELEKLSEDSAILRDIFPDGIYEYWLTYDKLHRRWIQDMEIYECRLCRRKWTGQPIIENWRDINNHECKIEND